ncbi:U32 family peptidase [Candidatus Venteria ishoeyi]|uniref:Ubiquinone biosynthesis protein UbiV n=1 Tax=Candidatus Venteria ishoeyi TaxID=1899563 RepID=A0A1H6F7P1_9GAMM|nr:U32 family peptidase [Candidatus Venteria ishoeyi]MDM8547612.1 U32 family peptidase [Candidatus Venteria ishoeyi]SEH06140.1 Peptidase family U32 [Candidatus Venteria ishoeyi]
MSSAQLALGPVLYYWPQQTLLDFYEQIITTPVDIIYLGETVCSKRKALRTGEWLELARHLKASGKEVVLSTLALMEAESELKTLRRLCDNGDLTVEANDMAAVQLLAGRPFVAGASLNIYNPHSLRKLADLGMQRWVLPLELGRETFTALCADAPAGVSSEVFAYGRLPLAYAARCFTARAHNLPKDDCQFRCLDDPDGLLLKTQEASPFLVLNGIQTQSAQSVNLLPMLDECLQAGADVLRISPQSQHTSAIINAFHAALNQQPAKLPNAPLGTCDGYWRGEAGLDSASA